MEALLSLEPAEAVGRLGALLSQPVQVGEELEALRTAVLELIFRGAPAGPLGYEARAALYREASDRGDEALMRLLRTSAAAETLEDPGRRLHHSVATLPLGVRRALAKGFDRGQLEMLFLDPDPIVIEHVLANPRVTEEDVVRIAAHRPIAAETLDRVARSERFGARPRVCAALARNPFAASDVAIHALPRLTSRELREVVADRRLHADTRAHARFELGRRRGST